MKTFPRAPAEGFTVVEMMVVLMITGMALALGFQSLMQWQIAEAALQRTAATTRTDLLTSYWWQDAMRAATPVEDAPFRGDGKSMQMMSLAPLFASSGGITPMAWEIIEEQGQVFLRVKEFERDTRLPISHATRAEFRYTGADGRTSSQWPPELTSQPTHLPQGIQLRLTTAEGEEKLWTVNVIGPLDPPFNAFRYKDDDA